MSWEKRKKEIELISGDRRSDRRYSLQMDLRWKLIRRRRVLDTGTGRTIDLSSSGILFEAGRPMPAGLNVELSITWPVLLRNMAPMQLVVSGRIVRAEGGLAAIRMVQHEFKTLRMSAEQRAFAGVNRAHSLLFAGAQHMGGLTKLQ